MQILQNGHPVHVAIVQLKSKASTSYMSLNSTCSASHEAQPWLHTFCISRCVSVDQGGAKESMRGLALACSRPLYMQNATASSQMNTGVGLPP